MSRTISTYLKLLLALSILTACAPPQDSFDILIVNGAVYDGSLNAGRSSNIGIIDDRIVTLSAAGDATATVIIDATGKLVMPGFIDPHTHALPRLQNPATSANRNFTIHSEGDTDLPILPAADPVDGPTFIVTHFDVVYEETDGGHTWKNWREYLAEFAPLLFR